MLSAQCQPFRSGLNVLEKLLYWYICRDYLGYTWEYIAYARTCQSAFLSLILVVVYARW